MGFLNSELKKRNLPELMRFQTGEPVEGLAGWERRKMEIQEILSRWLSGYSTRLRVRTEGRCTGINQESFGGKAITKSIQLELASDYSFFSFPFQLALPKTIKNPPIFIYLSFTPSIADGLGEEILDHGYGIASVYYQDIVPDYYDGHQNGLGRFCARNPYDSWGKLRLWAFGACRILDYIMDQEEVDISRIAVMGHSRLGKTALLAGAFDTRYSLTVSNESGAGGAALFRGKTGESIRDLSDKGSRLWFTGNFFDYMDRVEDLPFDQHFLLSLIAPNHLYVSSAVQDEWADPKSEFLACVAAQKAYEIYGKRGLVTPDHFPGTGDVLQEGEIGYHLRKGTHYLSRYDWQQVIAYRELHHV